MIVGVPREIKEGEYRVAAVPATVEAIVEAGHQVVLETQAGRGTGIDDRAYVEAEAQIATVPEAVFAEADMIVKVKEPVPQEYPMIREGQVVFTFFHFAASEVLTRAMVDSGALVQFIKQRLKAFASMRENTRRKVSWLGIPLGNSRCFLNQSSFAQPKSYMSAKLVAPQTTAQIAMNRMSINK